MEGGEVGSISSEEFFKIDEREGCMTPKDA